MTINKIFSSALILAALTFTSCSKEYGCTDPTASNYDPGADEDCCCYYAPTVTSNIIVSGSVTENTTWNTGEVYELAGKVVVESGATLTIEAGTIIKGRTGSGSLASALVVAKGGKLMADGTENDPIIFTSVLDNIVSGQLSGTNLTEVDQGKWGGLIILGNAPISAEEGDDFAQIEGIPADDTYGAYGGNNAADNSGVIRYVSIRHGGALIGEGNEINGLTLGGVGTGTVIDHVEIVSNVDDGIEFFGGTVNVNNLLVAFQGDDGVDIDQNYSGTVDNFLVIHGNETDEALEIDGPEGSLTDGFFSLINGTIISTDGTGSAADLKSKAQGSIEGVSFWGYNDNSWIKLRESFENDCTTDKTDAYDHFINGTLGMQNCEFEGGSSAGLLGVYTKSTDGSDNTCPIDQQMINAVTEEFSMQGHLTGAPSPTIGADLSKFDNWSWASINELY
jgi:hypothetical protein